MVKDIFLEKMMAAARVAADEVFAHVEDGADLGVIEKAVMEGARKAFVPLVEAAAQAVADRAENVCPVCKQRVVVEKKAARRVETLLGEICVRRNYCRCDKCKEWVFPADAALGLARKAALSPAVQETASLLALKMPPAQAQEICRRTTGLDLSCSTIAREAHRQGLRAKNIRDIYAEMTKTVHGVGELSKMAQHPGPQQPFTLIIEIDAFNIRERDYWGQTQERLDAGLDLPRWHWVYVGTCFRLDHRGMTESGRPFITQRGYVATRAGLEAFERQLYAEALLQGLTQADKTIVIADGAPWIWNIADDRYRHATHRLDLWHTKQHIWEVANDIYGKNTKNAAKWAENIIKHLENSDDGAVKTINALQELRSTIGNLTPSQLSNLEKQENYFANNTKRMDYSQAKQSNEPLGSGAIESTCKQYQCRFKRQGQFWSLDGDESLLALETLYKNNRWNQLFPHSRDN